jgi:hypothetical protein
MRLIAEYLERASRFEQVAEEATDPKFKQNLLAQADAYRKLAEGRAKKLNVSLPKPRPDSG